MIYNPESDMWKRLGDSSELFNELGVYPIENSVFILLHRNNILDR